jgi:nucleoside-diphosphate kinase
MSTEALEQTLVLIKPDALKLSLTGYVLSQLSEFHTGLRLAALKIVQVSDMLASEHYAEHRGKFFYPPLIDYIRGKLHYPNDPGKRRVVAIVYSGPDAVKLIRKIAGPTSPHVARDTAPGTVRALGTLVPVKDASGAIVGERMDNLIHASATPEEAEREIKLWFDPRDIMPAMRVYATATCEEHYYYSDGALHLEHTPGSIGLLAPGAKAWASDLAALRALAQGKPARVPLESIAAKYLINREPEPD